MALIEAVPNISEGRDESIIDAVVKSVEAGGSTILGVEPDVDYNRTVITYAGNKAEVTRSSVNLVETASKLIDMRNHHGNHPRMGAVDVMPFIALGESTDKDAERVAEDVYQILADDYSLFKYGLSASHPSRARLPSLRKGEYEGLSSRFSGGDWPNEDTRLPDNWDGATKPTCLEFGAMAIGARSVLVAYNINIIEAEPKVSSMVAKVIRSSGFVLRGHSTKKMRVKGILDYVQGMGVPLESHGISQVSMNLSNPSETGLHMAFEVVRVIAESMGVEVRGSEIVGLVPLQAMLDAGSWFNGGHDSEESLVLKAIEGLGLDQLTPFDPDSRIIEWAVRNKRGAL